MSWCVLARQRAALLELTSAPELGQLQEARSNAGAKVPFLAFPAALTVPIARGRGNSEQLAQAQAAV